MHKKKITPTGALLYVFLTVVLVFMMIPFVWLLISSLRPNADLFNEPFAVPKTLSFENFRAVMESHPMLLYFANSVAIATIATVIAVGAATLAAYAMQQRFLTRKSLTVLFSMCLFIPTNAFMVPYYVMINKIGLYDNVLGIALVYAGVNLPMSFMVIKGYMDTIPGELLESAKIDGATAGHDFFGKKISTADEEIVIQNVKIGDEGLPEVRLALDILPGCKRFVLENCQISNEEMAKLRDEYREQTKVVWRISFGKGTTLTDAQVIRAVYDLVDTNCDNLKYCEDARFMDIGHNEYLKTSEFISGMKSLEVLIISGSPIKDLNPLSECKNLRILEIANCGYITDRSSEKTQSKI